MIGELYAIDPGKHVCYVARFHDGKLVGVVPVEPGKPFQGKRGSVVLEKPQSYPNSPVPPQDLIDLLASGVAVASQFCEPLAQIKYVLPREWKKQVPKEICQKRIGEALDFNERMAVGMSLREIKPGLRHNAWDAVGIGLVSLGRLAPGCVPKRSSK